ncbi:right-handed parallel beta-helix repeat-containing protein [Candidatus Woesearchaeota archaeon]|nr:right-handed parallel beta-helix repeat-containing protein [Candidatus Woesearchaeota archaeon]
MILIRPLFVLLFGILIALAMFSPLFSSPTGMGFGIMPVTEDSTDDIAVSDDLFLNSTGENNTEPDRPDGSDVDMAAKLSDDDLTDEELGGQETGVEQEEVSSLTFVHQGFGVMDLPTHSAPLLKSQYSTNHTDEYLICYNQSTDDSDGNNVTNIYNFMLHDKSLFSLIMPFDTNSTTNTRDYSPYGNDGTLGSGSNAPEWIEAGFVGGAYRFDGNDYINLTGSIPALEGESFTIEVWVNGSDWNCPTSWCPIVTQIGPGYEGYSLYIYFDGSHGYPSFFAYDGVDSASISSSISIATGGWHHLAALGDGSNITLFVDGQLEASDVYPGSGWSATPSIGYDPVSPEYFRGSIDEVRVWDRPLSSEQISENYNSGSGRFDRIVAEETEVGDIWTCNVTPNDDTGDGTTLTSNSVTITQIPCLNISGDDIIIARSSTLCSAEYHIDDSDSNGAVHVGADNIEIDCNGSRLIGSDSGLGFNISDFENVTIRDCIIANYSWDIFSENSSNLVIMHSRLNGSVFVNWTEGSTLDLINTSSKTNSVNGNAVLNKTWYYQTYVSHYGTPLPGASANISDIDSVMIASDITDITGYTAARTLSEYVQDSVSIKYYSNYSVNISFGENLVLGDEFNMTHNHVHSVDIPCIYPFDGLIINSDTLLCSGSYDLADTGNNGLVIMNRSNIILDCNGSSFRGTDSGYAIYSYRKNSTVIRNCILRDYDYGVYINGGSGIKIENMTSYDNYYYGYYLNNLQNISVSDSIASGNRVWGFRFNNIDDGVFTNLNATGSNVFGFSFEQCDNNLISHCKAYDNDNSGFHIWYSNNNNITNCRSFGNIDGQQFDLSYSSNNTLSYSTAVGNGGLFSSGVYINTPNFGPHGGNTVYRCNISNAARGIVLANNIIDNKIISCNVFGNSRHGIEISRTNHTQIINASSYGNGMNGLYSSGYNLTVIDSGFRDNSDNGMYFANADQGHISNSDACSNLDDGIRVYRSKNMTFTDVTTDNNNNGFYVMDLSADINITNSSISNNTLYGIWFRNSSDNNIYSNHFINNTIQASSDNITNRFYENSTGTPRGNYWDDIFENDILISDMDHDGFGDSGDEYPYNGTNRGEVSGLVNDYGPMIGVSSYCGDNVCDPDESCSSCPEDCGKCPTGGSPIVLKGPGTYFPWCGDNICNDGETCAICPQDCGNCNDGDGGGGYIEICGNNLCGNSEHCGNCPADCGECILPKIRIISPEKAFVKDVFEIRVVDMSDMPVPYAEVTAVYESGASERFTVNNNGIYYFEAKESGLVLFNAFKTGYQAAKMDIGIEDIQKPVIIPPTFYEKVSAINWWFLILVVFLIVGNISYYIYSYRQRATDEIERIEKKLEELSRE